MKAIFDKKYHNRLKMIKGIDIILIVAMQEMIKCFCIAGGKVYATDENKIFMRKIKTI